MIRRALVGLALVGAVLLLIAWALSHVTRHVSCHPGIFCEGPPQMRFGSAVVLLGLAGLTALFVTSCVSACVLVVRGIRAVIRFDRQERLRGASS